MTTDQTRRTRSPRTHFYALWTDAQVEAEAERIRAELGDLYAEINRRMRAVRRELVPRMPEGGQVIELAPLPPRLAGSERARRSATAAVPRGAERGKR